MQDILDNFSSNISDQSEDWELKTYVGDKSEYYLSKWRDRSGSLFFSFNLGAFLIAGVWFIHRRMYLHAFILVLFSYIEGTITNWLFWYHLSPNDYMEYNSYLYMASTLIYGLVIGSIANYLYLKDATRKIKKIRAKNYSQDTYEMALVESGNPSWLYTIAGVMVYIGLFIGLGFLEELYYSL